MIRTLLLIIPSACFCVFAFFFHDLFYVSFAVVWLVFGTLFIKIPNRSPLSKEVEIKKKRTVNFSLKAFIVKVKRKRIKIKFSKTGGTKRLILVSIVYTSFVLAVLLFKANNDTNGNLLFNFGINTFELIRTYWVVVLGLLLSIFIALLYPIKKTVIKQFIKVSPFVPLILVGGWVLSGILVLLIAFIDTNITCIKSRFLVSGLNISYTNNQIADKIQKMDKVPDLIGVNGNIETVLIQHESLVSHYSKFYSQALSVIPKQLHISFKIPNSPMLLVGDTLIVKEINKDSIQQIGPIVASKYLKNNFSGRYLKETKPTIDIIGRQEYLKYRDEQINEAVMRIEGQIVQIKKNLGIAASNIQQTKNDISTLQSYIALNTRYRDDEYTSCMTETRTIYGYGYYSDYTYRVYSDSQCASWRQARDNKNAEYQSSINQAQSDLAYYQSQYQAIKEYLDQTENYSAFIEATKQQAPQELGLFEPESSIKVVLESTDNKSIADFFTTLVHEYLHYISYTSEERSLPLFFEEGLTEYYSRQVIDSQLKTKTNIGYPLITRIIGEIMKKVDPKELEAVYFNKDETALQALLDAKFGKNFYSDSELYFTLIPYLSGDEALKYANNIMYKIDGSKISENELYSQPSQFQ